MSSTPSGAIEPEFDAPFVFTADGHKSLYFTLDQLQSRMCSEHPTQLEVDYTRTMMGFLLLDSQPARIAMIGLGGGSLLKFCHRHLPQAQITAVEINPQVIALRNEFQVPDDERVLIICADGADFVRALPNESTDRYDVLLVDGFDGQGQSASLCSQRFYDDCLQALCPGGVLVVNLHHDHPDHGVFTGRLRLAFDGNVLEVPSKEKSNSILFARRNQRLCIDALRQSRPLEHVDPEMRAQLQQEFSRIGWEIRQAG